MISFTFFVVLCQTGLSDQLEFPPQPSSINPNCNHQDQAIECEDDCLAVLVPCHSECEDEHDCISVCMRQYTLCVDKCPCHTECFNGCPCDNESVYCMDCQERYHDEYHLCHHNEILNFEDCAEDCEDYDLDCDADCFSKYQTALQNCPCMKNCADGCPCEYYECTDNGGGGNGTDREEHLQGTLQIHPMKIDGECFKNFFNTSISSANYRKVTQLYKSSYPASATCISQCASLYHKTYKYAAIERGGYCYCGAAEPVQELHGQCAMPCSGSDTDYCGGPDDTATFYSLDNTEQRCVYGVEDSVDHDFNVTTIVADDNDPDSYKHCWAKFTCPKGYKVQYYFHYFETYGTSAASSSSSIVYLYDDPMGELIEYVGSGTATTRPVLYEWIDYENTQMLFEFRTTATKRGLRGFKMRLRCEKN